MKDASAGQMSSLLAGKHALVTGGSRGIGSAITRTLLSHGARVTVLGRNEKTLVDMARELTQDCELDSVVADVCESDAVSRAFEMLESVSAVSTFWSTTQGMPVPRHS